MTSHNRNTAILLVFLSVPFGLAIHDDATAKDSDRYDRYGYGLLGALGDTPYDDPAYAPEAFDYGLEDYSYDEIEALAAAIEAEPGMDERFFEEVLSVSGGSRGPALAGPLGRVEVGGSREAFERDYPSYEEWSWDGIPGYANATAEVEFAYDRVSQFQLVFPDDGTALGTLTAKWGPPQISDDEEEFRWFAPSKSLRFSLRSDYGEADLRVTAYQTLEEFVAPKAKLFGFEASDVFSLDEDAIDEILEEDLYGEGTVPLRQLRESAEPTTATYEISDNRVDAVEISLVLDEDAQRKMLKLLTAKLGTPKKEEGAYESVYRFRKGGRSIEWYVEDGEYCSLSLTRR